MFTSSFAGIWMSKIIQPNSSALNCDNCIPFNFDDAINNKTKSALSQQSKQKAALQKQKQCIHIWRQ